MENVFIGEHSTIREILQQIFVFGCYDRLQGASQLKISGSKYDNELKRLRCFWFDKTRRKFFSKNCLNYFPFDVHDENYLCRSYAVKAFSPQDLNLYLFSCMLLDSENFRTINAINDDVQMIFEEDSFRTPVTYTMLKKSLTTWRISVLPNMNTIKNPK